MNNILDTYNRELEYIYLNDINYSILSESAIDTISVSIKNIILLMKKTVRQISNLLTNAFNNPFLFFKNLIFGSIDDDTTIKSMNIDKIKNDIVDFIDEFNKLITKYDNNLINNDFDKDLKKFIDKYETIFSLDVSSTSEISMKIFREKYNKYIKQIGKDKEKYDDEFFKSITTMEKFLDKLPKESLHENHDGIKTLKQNINDICNVYINIITGYVSYIVNLGYSLLFNDKSITEIGLYLVSYNIGIQPLSYHNKKLIDVTVVYDKKYKKSKDYKNWAKDINQKANDAIKLFTKEYKEKNGMLHMLKLTMAAHKITTSKMIKELRKIGIRSNDMTNYAMMNQINQQNIDMFNQQMMLFNQSHLMNMQMQNMFNQMNNHAMMNTHAMMGSMGMF